VTRQKNKRMHLSTPPPNLAANGKINESARITEREVHVQCYTCYNFIYNPTVHACMQAQFHIFYNFITFKLRSTAEQMPALVSFKMRNY
jgi:hypothetical protein